MKYPVAIHKDPYSCFGVIVPDVPGCHSAGETLDKALENAREAISSHLEILAEEGVIAPSASLVDEHLKNPDYQDAVWAYVDVNVSAFLGKRDKATITLPALLIKQIDAVVRAGLAKNRSSFLADSAIKALGAIR